ncbi:hypothetical protein BDP27DRAFT_1332649 [Rhodocollybia butyracea]|uniref:Uncharacterized protein n=1 Tax=Rhodocollybia butyracea TaxID=206335 RepID=A0A9P5PM53_9AGAR|nr:hypothetical protein BDP27DRAFT_1332649 [Rhodocollybia butyracea]
MSRRYSCLVSAVTIVSPGLWNVQTYGWNHGGPEDFQVSHNQQHSPEHHDDQRSSKRSRVNNEGF